MNPNLFSKLKARQIIEIIQKVNLEVEKLPIEKQRHFCLDCRIQLVGDDKNYGLLEDTAICSCCGKNTDVVNYSIVKLVEGLTTNKESLYFYQGEDGKSYGIDRIYRESVKRSVTK